jgi:hypothetical protein
MSTVLYSFYPRDVAEDEVRGPTTSSMVTLRSVYDQSFRINDREPWRT